MSKYWTVLLRRVGATSLVLMLASAVSAHHSFAAFNRSEAAKASLRGQVKQFALINPHGSLKLVVAERGQKTALWTFELSSATQLLALGWNAQNIRVGDVVTVTYFPLRFGSYGGQLVSVLLPDGKTLSGTAVPDRGYPTAGTGQSR